MVLMVEGHVPLGREGSTPSQRTEVDTVGGGLIPWVPRKHYFYLLRLSNRCMVV